MSAIDHETRNSLLCVQRVAEVLESKYDLGTEEIEMLARELRKAAEQLESRLELLGEDSA